MTSMRTSWEPGFGGLGGIAAVFRRMFWIPPRSFPYCQAFIVAGRESLAVVMLMADGFAQCN